MKKKLFLFGVGFVVVVTAVLLVLQSRKPSTDTIQIGAALPLTGDSASWGEKARDGINLALAEWQAKQGDDGLSVEIDFEDTAGNATGGSTAIRTLLTRNNPIAVIGGITSGATAAMAPLCQERRVVLLSPTASANALSDAGSFFFRLWPRDAFETEVFARYLVEQGIGQVAVLFVQNEYGSGVKEVFEEIFPRVGGTIQTSQGYAPNETAFRPLLTRLKAQDVENIYIAGYYRDASLIMTQARDVGGNFNFFGTTTVGDPQVIELAGTAANGLVFSELSSFNAEHPADETASRFVTAFRERYGRLPGWAEAHAYDALALLLSALDTGARDGGAIRRYLDDLTGFPGVTGAVEFDEHGDVVGRRIAIKTIRDGNIVVVDTVSR